MVLGPISALQTLVPVHCQTTFPDLPMGGLLSCPSQLRTASSTAPAPMGRRLQILPICLHPASHILTAAAQPLCELLLPSRSGSGSRASPPRERALHSAQSSLADAVASQNCLRYHQPQGKVFKLKSCQLWRASKGV